MLPMTKHFINFKVEIDNIVMFADFYCASYWVNITLRIAFCDIYRNQKNLDKK